MTRRRRNLGALLVVLACTAAALGARPAAGGAGGRRAGEKQGHASFVAELDCAACHTPAGWQLSAGAGGGFDHARTGFPLRGAHAKTPCTGCHVAGRETQAACASCHTDAHQGRLGTTCEDCHSAVSWLDTRARELHRRTLFPLTGRHALLDCQACHLRAAESVYGGVPADCFACHEADYRVDLHPRHEGDPADPASAFPRNCARCHRTTSWSPAFVDPTALPRKRAAALRRHDRRFPLSFGKHRGAECASCHPVPDAPRIVACDGCHAHDAQLLRVRHGRLLVGQGGAACLRCHPRGAAR